MMRLAEAQGTVACSANLTKKMMNLKRKSYVWKPSYKIIFVENYIFHA